MIEELFERSSWGAMFALTDDPLNLLVYVVVLLIIVVVVLKILDRI